MSADPMAYVGSCHQCGGAYMIVVDTPEHARETAMEIGKVIDAGDTIERITVDEARAMWRNKPCRCESVEDLGGGVPAGAFICYAPPSPETVAAAELERLVAWNAGQPRKVGP